MVRKRRCWIKQFQPYDKNQNKQPRCLHPLAMRVNYANAAASNTRHSVPQSYTQCNTRKMACAVEHTFTHHKCTMCYRFFTRDAALRHFGRCNHATTKSAAALRKVSIIAAPCLPRAQTVLGVWSSCQHARRAYAGTVGARAPQLYSTGADRRPSSCQHARCAYAGTVGARYAGTVGARYAGTVGARYAGTVGARYAGTVGARYAGTVGARAPQLYGTGGDRRPSSCQHARRAYAGTVGARAPQLYGTGGDRRPSSCQHARRAYAGTVHVVCAQELRAPTVWHR